jgi:hypothetical protein
MLAVRRFTGVIPENNCNVYRLLVSQPCCESESLSADLTQAAPEQFVAGPQITFL